MNKTPRARSLRKARNQPDVQSSRNVKDRSTALPDFVSPQLATLVDAVPEGNNWLHEIKLDGYRILARIEKGNVALITRNQQDWTDRCGFLVAPLAKLPVTSALLDGEVVALNENGTSNFQLLQNSLSGQVHSRLVYYVFDLLHLDGAELTSAALLTRKERLTAVIKPASSSPVRYSEHWIGDGQRLYQEACRKGLEGIISKRADQPYRSGRSRDWLKVKCVQNQEFVIGGFTDPAGSRAGLGALLVGVHDDKKRLLYAGKVGTGFTRESLLELRSRLEPLLIKSSPFVNPPRGAEARNVHWVKPELIGAVSFAEWTEDNFLRHPSFQGLREDKPPAQITRDRAVSAGDSAVAAANGTNVIAGIKLSHADRILYPEQGITKGELARYYESVGELILPHLSGRPLTLLRCPEGRKKQCFYQRHVSDSMPEPIVSIRVKEKSATVLYVGVDSLAGVIALVQMGVLEIHTWNSRTENLERPDRMIFDLDPDPALSWAPIRETAHKLRRTLTDLGLVAFIKTTGGKGLHIVVPLVPQYTWEQVRLCAKRLTQDLVKEAPDLYVATMSKAKRDGKIFIDYLRNARSATAVCAYSTRARPSAPVSVPISWEELSHDVRGDCFTIRNVPQRLARLRDDLWNDYESSRRRIPAALLARSSATR